MAGAGTIRVLVPLDQLAGVLRLVATNVPLGEDAQVKVQDPTREPRDTRLPVRGFQEPRRAPRGAVAIAVLLEFDAPERLRVVRLRQVDDPVGVVDKLRAAGLVVLDGDDRDRSGVRG